MVKGSLKIEDASMQFVITSWNITLQINNGFQLQHHPVCYYYLPCGVVDVDGEVAVVTAVVDPPGLEVSVGDVGWVVEGGSE